MARVSSASHASSSPTKHWPFIFATPKRLFIFVSTTFVRVPVWGFKFRWQGLGFNVYNLRFKV